MKYYVLLTIQAPNSEQFIEVGLDYDLPFHPNLTDQLTVAGFPCEIKEIYFDMDYFDYITMRVKAIDNLLSMRNNPSEEDIHAWLTNEWLDLCSWVESNNERIVLNNYFYHPEKQFRDTK